VSTLLEAFNSLLATAIAEGLAGQVAPDSVEVRSVVLDIEGARIEARLRPPAGEGPLVLRLRAESTRGEQQALVLTCEQAPEHWNPALEPFRRVLERARLRLELDFTELDVTEPDPSP